MEFFAVYLQNYNKKAYNKTGDGRYLPENLPLEPKFLPKDIDSIVCHKSHLGPHSDTFKGSKEPLFQLSEVSRLSNLSSYQELFKRFDPLTEDGSLVKKVLEPGVGKRAVEGSPVWVHFCMCVEGISERHIGSSQLEHFPFSYVHGRHSLAFWNLAVASMELGEMACFVTRPQHAFGELGCPPLVPKAANILCFLHLMDVPASTRVPLLLQPRESIQGLGVQELLAEAKTMMDVGMAMQADGEFELAQQCLLHALDWVENYFMEEPQTENDMFHLDCLDCFLRLLYTALGINYLNRMDSERVLALAQLCLEMGIGVEAQWFPSVILALAILGDMSRARELFTLAVCRFGAQEDLVMALEEGERMYLEGEDRVLQECMVHFVQLIMKEDAPVSVNGATDEPAKEKRILSWLSKLFEKP